MDKNYILLIVSFIIISFDSSYCQVGPNCDHLEVTHMKFLDAQHDTLLVSVYNSCNLCISQWAYTGLIAYQNNDTLAMTGCLTCLPSPPNNDELDYYLLTKKNFEINNIDRIQMVNGDCDSIPFSSALSINKSHKRNFSYTLYQNYPNPFNPNTTIEFEIFQKSEVKLFIYNMQGHLIQKLVNANLNSGKYSRIWNGTNQLGEKVSSGLYIYKIFIGNFSESRKLLLLK